MQNKLASLVFLMAMSANSLAAENLYAQNYKAQNIGNLVSLEPNPDTKMYVSNHKDEDNISMLEKGYDMMGTSGFEAGDVPADLALQHGRTIKADTVLVYSKYGSAKTAASKISAIKESAKKNGGEVDPNDLQDEPTQYKYFASYWAKLPTPLLGVHIIKLIPKNLDENEKKVSASNSGLKVLAVIKDSPADKAGLVRGDVLYKIGSTSLNKPEDLSPAVRQLQGQTVPIEYERDGAKAITTAKINQR
jgi:PDZ domain